MKDNNNRHFFILITTFFTSLSIISCSLENGFDAADKEPAGLQATFSSIEENVFRPRCALSGCHGSDTKEANLDLSTQNAYNNLVNVQSILSTQGFKRVNPGDSETSFLIKALDGSNPVKMPLGETPLDASTVAIIAQWIDDGAKND